MMKARLNSDLVRETCIKQNWYTAGDVNEYGDMLNTAGINEILEIDYFETIVLDIAHDIFNRSDIDLTAYGCTKSEYIDNIAFYLLNDCSDYFMR